jgi:hypothetical protein
MGASQFVIRFDVPYGTSKRIHERFCPCLCIFNDLIAEFEFSDCMRIAPPWFSSPDGSGIVAFVESK